MTESDAYSVYPSRSPELWYTTAVERKATLSRNADTAEARAMVAAAITARPASMRSKQVRRKRKDEDETACRFNVGAAGKALDVRFSHWHKGLCCAT